VRNFARVTYITFLCILLSSCGFKLRGTEGDVVVHLKKGVTIVDRTSDAWLRILRPRLEAAGIPIIENPKKAPYKLTIHRQSLKQEITGVSSSTTPRLYQLTYTVTFSLKQTDGRTLIPAKKIVVTRPMTQNNDRVLGSRYEAEKIKNEMRLDAASSIMGYLYRKDPDLKPK